MQIASHPTEANLGGDPSITNKIRAYVELKFWKNGNWTDKRLEVRIPTSLDFMNPKMWINRIFHVPA